MLLFLSHSGNDTDAAKELKRRLLASPAAAEARLEVWLDVDELGPGDEWQPAIEKALNTAHAFLVYVGSRGVLNWVDREVRMGLTRATGADAIAFLPVLGSTDLDESILPPFARQFQAISDPLGDETALAKLLAAIVGGGAVRAALTDRPFVGLRAMGEAEADRFFGRADDVEKLSALLRRQRLAAVVADSGAGKSSLVRAGLVPAFRGGALVPEGALKETPPRHVVVMRPGADPVQGLRDGIDRAARALGRDAAARRSLRQSVRSDDAGETYYALACDIDHAAPDILLVVDQFEELLTTTPESAAADFVDLLLALVDNDAKPLRAVLTVRADYYNLIRPFEALFQRLEADDGAAQLRLKRISDAGLAEIVERPLVMAGHADAAERAALIGAIRRDVTGRPGDVALVQMALYATWRRTRETGADLMTAYAQVHGVLGALAHQAEATRRTLSETEAAALLPLFARLIRLGDTGGATRRVARLDDLDKRRASLAQKLATEAAGRLLMVGGDTVEIAHEALVAQWPWLQAQIQAGAEDIRTLARLGDRARAWRDNGSGALPPETERRAFEELAGRHPDWLSEHESDCLAAARRRASALRWAAVAAIAAIVIFGAVAGVMAVRAFQAEGVADEARSDAVEARDLAIRAQAEAEAARDLALEREKQLREQTLVLEEETRRADEAADDARYEAERATEALAEAAKNAAGGLVALAQIAENSKDWPNAIRLALAAWPRGAGDGVQLMDVVDTLSKAMPGIATRAPDEAAFFGVRRAEFSPDGRFYAFQPARNARVELHRTATGETLLTQETYVRGSNFAFSPDGRFFAAGSRQGRAVLVALDAPDRGIALQVQGQYVSAVAFSPDGERLYAAIPQGTIYAFGTGAIGPPVDRLQTRLPDELWFMQVAPDGASLALGTRQGILELWDLGRRAVVARSEFPLDDLEALEFGSNGKFLIAYQGTGQADYSFWGSSDWDSSLLAEIEAPLDVIARNPDLAALPTETALVHADGPIYAAVSSAILSFGLGDLELGPELFARLGKGNFAPTSLELSPDGRILAVAERDQTLSLWRTDTAAQQASYKLGVRPILAMAFISGTELAAVDAMGAVSLVDLARAPEISWRTPDGGPYPRTLVSPDGSHMAGLRQSGQVIVHKLPGGEELAEFTRKAASSDFYLAPGGAVAAEFDRETVHFFDLRRAPAVPAPVSAARADASGVDVAAFAADARIFALAGGARAAGWIAAYETETGKQVLRAEFQRSTIVRDLAFAPDGTAVGVAAGWTFDGGSPYDGYTWFALDGSNARLETAPEPLGDLPADPVFEFLEALPATPVPHPPGVMTPDRRRLAVLDQGGVVIYDTATGAIIARLEDKLGDLVAFDFPASDTLHAVTEDGRIGTWDLTRYSEGSAFDVACRLLPDPDLGPALADYPITTEPICGEGYDPPLPAWLTDARDALKLSVGSPTP